MRIRDFFYIVISALVLRGFLEIFLGAYTRVDPYYASLLCQAGMYLLIAAVAFHTMSREDVASAVGRESVSQWPMMLVFWPAILIMFSFGENALEILLFSHIDKNFSYSHFNLHDKPLLTYAFISWRVACFVFVTSIIAPVVEEFIFRGVLLRLMLRRFGPFIGVIISSAIFTLFHFSRPEYLSVFIFSIFVSVLYLRYGSLILSVMVHATYNFMAFIIQYYYDFQWHRSLDHISRMSDWVPQLIMLSISSPILAYFFIYCHKGVNEEEKSIGAVPVLPHHSP